MKIVDIKAFANKLDAVLAVVAQGGTLQITDQGKVITEIVPPRGAAPAPSSEERWAELIRQGLVTPASVPPDAPLPPPSDHDLGRVAGRSR